MFWCSKNSNCQHIYPDKDHSFYFFAFNTTHLNLTTEGELDALDSMVTVLSCLSMVGEVLKETFIVPCLPGSTGCNGFSTEVHPHSTLVSLITKGWLPILVNRYSNFRVSPLYTKPKCCRVLSNLIMACPLAKHPKQRSIARM
jgi:hypothetical protein